MKTHQWLKSICALTMTITSCAAEAKSIDYSALEQLFNEPVTTSVTGTPQRESEVPGTMEIITADEIRRSGAHDIPGVLRYVAGIDVLQWANNDADVGVRGYNQAYSPRLLVLIDGRQVYVDYYGYTAWSTLPVELNEIRQIEIVYGPNTALYGFNAAGGVINIITYNPLYDNNSAVSASGGTQQTKEGSVIATKKTDNAGIRIAGGARGGNDFSTPQQPDMVGSRRGDDRGEVNLLARKRLTDKVEASLEATYSKVDQNEFVSILTDGYTRYKTQSLKGDLSADTNFGVIQATAYQNYTAYQLFIATSNVPYVTLHNQNTVTSLSDSFKVSKNHIFRVSAEYRHNTMPTTTTLATVFYNVASAGGMWNWKITPTVALTNAVRLDHLTLGREGVPVPNSPFTNAQWNNRALTEKSFNSGLVWQSTPVDTLHISAARGILLPNLLEFGGEVLPFPGVTATGSPYIKPSAIMNYEAGWDRILHVIDAQTRVTVFHQFSQDVMTLGGGFTFVPPASAFVFPANMGRSEATGMAFQIKGHFLRDWRWGLSYTPETIHDNFNLPFTTSFIDYQSTLPVNVINGNLGWSSDKWETDGFFRYESNFYNLLSNGGVVSLVPVQHYISVDGRVGYKLTKETTLALSGQNLLHSPQNQTSAPDVQRRVLFTVTVKV
jgi:iron complex outermembrane receptor protein